MDMQFFVRARRHGMLNIKKIKGEPLWILNFHKR